MDATQKRLLTMRREAARALSESGIPTTHLARVTAVGAGGISIAYADGSTGRAVQAYEATAAVGDRVVVILLDRQAIAIARITTA